MNKNLFAIIGRVVLYLRSKHGATLDHGDIQILSNLMQARTHPTVIIDFIENMCHCKLTTEDKTVITAFHVTREIQVIVTQFESRPAACKWN